MGKKKIGLWDLVFMNVTALFGIRWIAKSTAASLGLGLGAIPTWILFAFIFFVPSALICAELASTYPRDGGLYEWVKEAYGEKWGFIVSWLNWTSKIFWYSSFLTFLSINVSYALGNSSLATNKVFILILSLVTFWALSLISTKGMGFAKIFTNVGALGSTIPTVLLITLSFISVLFLGRESVSVYTVSSMIPKFSADSFVSISAIMFALAGCETTANFVTEIENPNKNFPKAICIAAAIVAGLYVTGSIAITMIMSPEEITASMGILDALDRLGQFLGLGPWFIQIIAAGIFLSVLGAIVIYIASPIKMLFGSVKKGVFPEAIMEVNEHNIPVKAVLLQAVIVSIILLGTNLLPSVDVIYNVLVMMTALTALFPYIILFISYIRLRKERLNENRPYEVSKNNARAIGIAKTVLIVCIIGVIGSLAPVMPTLKDNIIYELQMIGGGIVVTWGGLLIWKNYVKKTGFKEDELA